LKVLSVAFSAGGTTTWTADRDYVLVGAGSTLAANVWVGVNATITTSEVITPTSSYTEFDVYYAIAANSATTSPMAFHGPMKIPILAGSTLKVGASAQTRVLLYLDEISGE